MLGIFTYGARVGERTDAGVLSRMSAVTASFVLALGFVVLIGWAADIAVLKQIRPTFAAMNPLTASCLILSGIAIQLVRSGRRGAARAVATFILLLALAKIADLVWAGIPVDQLLFPERLRAQSGIPNAMAPNTALAFTLVALGLIFGTGRRSSSGLISQVLGASGLLISMFAIIGYAFGIDHMHSVGPFIPMALHTGFGLAMASLGVMSLTPQCGLMLVLRDRGPAGSMARIVLPLAIFIPVAIGAMRLWGQSVGYYGTEAGVALQVIANVLAASILLTSSIIALYRSDGVRRAREQDLARSEERYRLAEKVAQVGHWRMDLPSLEVCWSDEVFRICGIAKDDGVPCAREVLEIYHPDDRRIVRQSVRDALRDGRGWEYVVRIHRRGGELRHISSHGVCERDSNGRLTSVFGVFADITELEHARRKAEDATAAKAEFLANMSHEIRTPLNGVMGFAELLLASQLAPEQNRHATLVFESAETLLKLLNDILDVSKIDAGLLEIAQEPFDPAHQLRQCVRLMDGMAVKKGLTLTLAVDPGLPQHIMGDDLRLRQIVLNLLGNAIKFTTHGTVTVEAKAALSSTGARMLEIRVADTGVGIPQARLASVFDEFVQADVSTSRRFGGSGLGLTISRRLAALMQGDLELESQEGEGTRVTLILPLRAVDHRLRRRSDSVARPAPGRIDAGTARKGTTILLAEDLDINQELITGMLGRMGYRVEIACDGGEAIRLAGRLREQPDAYGLILMDIQMPMVDGITATQAIRALGGRAAEIPIVALTANAYAADIEECRRAGMMDHLSKPVSMAALGAVLSRWLGTEAPAAERRRSGVTNEPSVKAKYADRKAAYASRLAELGAALPASGALERELLLAEAERMAHNLAGTAGMFGEPSLGDAAIQTENALRADGTNGEVSVDRLLQALRRAA